MNNIIKGIICFITVIVLSVVVSGESHAVGNYYYNGLQSPNDSNALKKQSKLIIKTLLFKDIIMQIKQSIKRSAVFEIMMDGKATVKTVWGPDL